MLNIDQSCKTDSPELAALGTLLLRVQGEYHVKLTVENEF